MTDCSFVEHSEELIPILETPIDNLTAEIDHAASNILDAARLAVFSLPVYISSRHFVYFRFGDWYEQLQYYKKLGCVTDCLRSLICKE